jgi:IS30 family transposase
MLRMLDRHAVHALLKAGQSTKEIAVQMGVTRRTIQRIAKEPAVEEADDAEALRRRASAALRCRRRLGCDCGT